MKDLTRYKQVTTAEAEERSQDETLLRCSINSIDRNIMDFDYEPTPVGETKVFFGGSELENGDLVLNNNVTIASSKSASSEASKNAY